MTLFWALFLNFFGLVFILFIVLVIVRGVGELFEFWMR